MVIELPESYDWRSPPLPERRETVPAGRVLCFAPHPDDEVIGAGATMCLHRRQGDPVRVVMATDGTGGDPDGRYGAERLADVRRAECRAACAALGIEDVVFWGFPDGFEVVESDIVGVALRVAEQVEDFAPDRVYFPWDGEWHSDHRALHWAVLRGLADAGFDGEALGYEVWSALPPDVVVHVSSSAEAKREALSCHRSQLEYCNYIHPSFGLMAYRSLLFHRAEGYCEAFRRYSA